MEVNTIQCLSKEKCTGCASCINRCPLDCITMQSDEEGFLFPVIDESRCTRCGECKAICPVLRPPEKPDVEHIPDCYAAWSKDAEIRFHSTSGGVFTHLARAVLGRGGFVAGARYRADHLVEHTLISSETELEVLRQSKYVQSEIGLVYREIRARLEQGKQVLFTGTPCQCAGLRAFLGREYDSLFLCDFICRGVNSPKVYLAYLHELEKRYGTPVKQVWFKNKTYGWNRFCTKIVFEDGQEYLADRDTDPFMLGYIKSKLSCYMRPSCYQCRFKGINRPVDITLGDFWGIQVYTDINDADLGVSAVLLHTPKGKKIFKDISHELYSEKQNVHTIISHNRCLAESVCGGQLRHTAFFSQLQRNDASFFQTIAEFNQE